MLALILNTTEPLELAAAWELASGSLLSICNIHLFSECHHRPQVTSGACRRSTHCHRSSFLYFSARLCHAHCQWVMSDLTVNQLNHHSGGCYTRGSFCAKKTCVIYPLAIHCSCHACKAQSYSQALPNLPYCYLMNKHDQDEARKVAERRSRKCLMPHQYPGGKDETLAISCAWDPSRS